MSQRGMLDRQALERASKTSDHGLRDFRWMEARGNKRDPGSAHAASPKPSVTSTALSWYLSRQIVFKAFCHGAVGIVRRTASVTR